MKKKLLLGSIMLGAALTSTAQITITQNDLSNWYGATVIQAHDSVNLSSISPGNAGASQTWNLTAIGNDFQDTMQFLNPAGMPCSNNFPTATYGILVPDFVDGYAYLSVNATSLEFLGFCGVIIPPDTMTVPFTPPQKQLTFPSTFNTAFTGQTKQIMQFPNNPPPPDSIRIVSTINYTSLIDGWGNVTTLVGTYPSLRGKYTQYKIDSMFVYMLGSWQFSGYPPSMDTTITYDWWINNNFPVATIETDANGQVTSTSYVLQSTIGIEEANPETSHSFVFPNPASESFTIVNHHPDAKIITIIDALGKKILEANITKPDIQFSAKNLNRGMYFYLIRKANGETVSSGKILLE